jgi:hypothetical protein
MIGKLFRRAVRKAGGLSPFLSLAFHLVEYLVVAALLVENSLVLLVYKTEWALGLGLAPFLLFTFATCLEAADIFGLLQTSDRNGRSLGNFEVHQKSDDLFTPLKSIDLREEFHEERTKSSLLAIRSWRERLVYINENFFNVNTSFMLLSIIYMNIAFASWWARLYMYEESKDLKTVVGNDTELMMQFVFFIIFFLEFMTVFDCVAPDSLIFLIAVPLVQDIAKGSASGSKEERSLQSLYYFVPLLSLVVAVPMFLIDTRVPVCGVHFPGARLIWQPRVTVETVVLIYLYPVSSEMPYFFPFNGMRNNNYATFDRPAVGTFCDPISVLHGCLR